MNFLQDRFVLIHYHSHCKKKRLYKYVFILYFIFKIFTLSLKKVDDNIFLLSLFFYFWKLKHPNQQGAVLHDFNVNSPLNVRDAH